MPSHILKTRSLALRCNPTFPPKTSRLVTYPRHSLSTTSPTTPQTQPSFRVLLTGASSEIGRAVANKLRRSNLRADIILVSRTRKNLVQTYGEDAIAEAESASESGKWWMDTASVDKGGANHLATAQMEVKEKWEQIYEDKNLDDQDAQDEGKDRPFAGVEEKDVTNPEDWNMLAKEWPYIDVLINAAGYLNRSLISRQNVTEIARTINTNLMGPIYGSRVYAKAMMKQKQGVIINISSILATRGGQGAVAYASSKAGLIGLTHSLTNEVTRYGVRVNAILPGWIGAGMGDETILQNTLGSNWLKQQRMKIPLQRFGTPSELADAVVFLIRNRYAAGCILNLDGGLSAVD